MVITSTSNEKIKRLRAICRDRKYRYAYGEYVAEGVTIVKDIPDEYVVEIFVKESRCASLADYFNREKVRIVKDEIFDSVADTVTPSGVIATIKIPTKKEVIGDEVVLLCGLSDAGNVGTIVRTACAKGIKTVVCVETADPFSPKAVRASMGGITKVNVVQTSYEEALDMLAGYELIVLDMNGICIYDYKKADKIIIAVGNEAHGIPAVIRDRSDAILSIPMVNDGVESLNAAVSAGIAIYTILR